MTKKVENESALFFYRQTFAAWAEKLQRFEKLIFSAIGSYCIIFYQNNKTLDGKSQFQSENDKEVECADEMNECTDECYAGISNI